MNDPLLTKFPGKIMVGLAYAKYSIPSFRGTARNITWQADAKHYQFWARSDEPDGGFKIPNVAPGDYTLYAIADGVLGEFSRATSGSAKEQPSNWERSNGNR